MSNVHSEYSRNLDVDVIPRFFCFTRAGYLVVLYFFRKKGEENKKSLDFFYPEI